jgi:hypothetical protein
VRRYPRRVRLAVWTLCVSLVAMPAAAAGPAHVGFPGFDAAREHIVFGGVPGGSGFQPVPQARSAGTWREDQHALAFVERAVGRDGLWLAGDPLADGLVRLRIELAGKVDLSLLVRAAADPAVELRSGYGVSLAGDRLRLDRWDHGVAVPLTPAVKVVGLGGKLRRVEVVVMLLGPQISAQVYDGGTFTLLASVSGRDDAYPTGQVGLRTGPRQAPEHRFTLLAAMPIAPPGAPATGQGPFGSLRFFFVDPASRDRLPGDLRGRLIDPLPVDGIASELALLLGPADAERLRRSGAVIVGERGELPWAATDPDFRARAGKPPERTPTGFRVDATYKDPALVEGLLRAYADRFPRLATLHEIGRSHADRPLLALKISDHADRDEDEPAVLINGAHHGSELLSIEYTLDAVRHLLEEHAHDPAVRRAVDGLEIWCVPLVNPDGNYNYMHRSRARGRKNGRDNDGDGSHDDWDGVDLNRNYPFQWGALGELGSRSLDADDRYRGTAPASEPETAAMMRLARERRFVAAISFHTLATAILSPYTIDGVVNPEADEAWAFAEALAAAAPEQPNGRMYRVRRQLYPVDGTDQDWHRHAHGTLAYIVEGSHHNPRDPEVRGAAIAATRPVWLTMLAQVLGGPGITVHVKDTSGAPVEAEVVIEELAPREGERWTSRPRDGRVDRVVPAAGRYTVRASGPAGCAPVRRTVEVRPRADVELVVPAAPCESAP